MSSEPHVRLIDGTSEEFRSPTEPRWYLAYGSNLSASTFLVRRGIKPLAKENVLVKGIELAFDNPGVPYVEPRFANCRLAHNTPTDFQPDKEWNGQGSLLGVAYLVSAEDFREILKTEGGGTSYQPLLVTALVLSPEGIQTNQAREVYTLLASKTRTPHGEASLRYMTLLRNGARENAMPAAYITYLDALPHYRITTTRQRLGRIFYLVSWMPGLLLFFSIVPRISDKDGNVPGPVKTLRYGLFGIMWAQYDWFGKWLFGDAEKTMVVDGARTT